MSDQSRAGSRRRSLSRYLKWLVPGIGVKRWLILLALGIASLGLAVVYLVLILYHGSILPDRLYQILTIQFLSPWARLALAAAIGLAAITLALFQLSRSLLAPFVHNGTTPLADAILQHRRLNRGPRIVAIGGGTGLSTLLRGLKHETTNLTAIITVADDGGSSGRLRRELGLPPPGDFRNCIAALANDEALTTQLFQYRFGSSQPTEQPAGGDLAGHSFGNLFIAAMTGVTGSFERGLEQSSHVLAIQGDILPSTLANVTLVADVREQTVRRVTGESHIPKAPGRIERVYLSPEHAPAYPAAVRAILTADLVVLGPGSLYTSVIPNLLVRGIRDAIKSTRAPVVYVCNTANQAGETDNYDSDDYVRAMERHIGRHVIDAVLINSNYADLGRLENIPYVQMGKLTHIRLVASDLVDSDNPRHHDSGKLAKAILSLVGS